MLRSIKVLAISAALAIGAAMFATAPASAAPLADRGVVDAIQQEHAQVEKARVVCNAYGRCWRTAPRYYARPNYVRPYYAPRRVYRGPRVVCNAYGRCWRRY